MHVRRHNFVASALPPPPIVVLIKALDIQLDRNKPQGRHTVTAHGILHGKCGVVHETVRAVQIIKTLSRPVSIFDSPRKGGAHTLQLRGELAEDSLDVPSYIAVLISGVIIYA